MKVTKIFTALALSLALALTCVGLVACDDAPEAFKLSQSSLEMQQYEEYTLTANKEGEIEWSSSDPRTVRVENGLLTSLKLGDATITATLGEESATCEVSVRASTKGRAITVDQETVTLAVGATDTITAELKEDGTVISGVTLSWASDNTAAVTVDNGVVTGVASGTANVTASVVYKGQALSRTVVVTCIDDSNTAVDFSQTASSPDGSIAAYSGDVTALGFAAGTEVQEWTSVTQTGSAVWAEGAVRGEYERLIVDISIASPLTAQDIVVTNAGEDVTGCGAVAGVRIDSVLYYNAEGELVSDLTAGTVYTMVVDLRSGGTDTSAYGIALKTAGTAYLANGVACSDEWYLSNYEHDVPSEPITDGLYIAKMDGVGNGQEFTEISGMQTEGDYAGMYQVAYMTDIWGERICIAREDMLGYQGQAGLHFKYRDYDYFGFEVEFTAAVPDLTVWTGGYALFIRSTGITAEGGNTVLPNDIYIYDETGADVTGSVLQSNVRYTFKIRIHKDDPDNASFGFGVPGETTNYFYIGNPFFQMA